MSVHQLLLINSTYSCVIVCAPPQAPEKIVNMAREEMVHVLRPRISLNFAQMMINPRVKVIDEKSEIKLMTTLTSVCQKITRQDPPRLSVALQVVGDS